ncbi:hypothetical protein B0H19DRAFT_1109697 [Mycena capillaripes]|nr:hypothetical protein B0H19DRAFT_1109697 [Mycena capillaripes]
MAGIGSGQNNRQDRFDNGTNNTGLGHTTNMNTSAPEGGFNDYGVTEVASGGSNNRDNLGTSGNTGGHFGSSAMDYNSGAGNTGGGFDTGSAAGTGGASAMDYNSGAGNTGGGFDTGSAGGYGTSGNTASNFGTSAMDDNSGPGNTGGRFDVGSGADTTGYGSGNTTSTNEYGAGTTGTTTSSNEYGATSANSSGKPTMGDKVKGGAEKLIGKVTKNPDMVERGQERKQGEFSNNNAGAGGYDSNQNY